MRALPPNMQGVKIRRNPKNKFVVFELRYDADPAKRDPAYIDAIKSAMPIQQFKQEYEIEWDTFEGMPVFRDFNADRHCAKEEPHAVPGLPLLRGWDFGLTPSCVVAQLQGSQLFVLREFVEQNCGAKQFAAKVLPQIQQLWPQWYSPGKHWFDFIDPAGFNRDQSDEGQCSQELADCGLIPIGGPISFEERRSSVESFLIKRTREGEGFQIWEPTCPMLVKGFKGGYAYPPKAKTVEPQKLRPVKNAFSHPHDGLQYITGSVLRGGLRGDAVAIPALSYFQR
jgi:hypothetical protein